MMMYARKIDVLELAREGLFPASTASVRGRLVPRG